ncbi:SDR family NAD(P)-dependent oxidoreductase [Aquabacterium sp.]|uniref:SDR family NAD(P)-dependent oxidoreductase n=1 Tax=Aquabacterium sp. TaxID=1872578 RepID=UPI002C3AC81D|nr:SDR family NAD(P)-dependent oxidoreductase [Aquabacterium sp.]HSW06740.1 SDR family NAD(P)-dependent oxidoreductase [Aquabacterium sp.]
MKLARRLALVTGGASGLGEATVQWLLAMDAFVAVIDKDATRLQAMQGLAPERLATAAIDVSDEVAVASFLDASIARFGELRLCVNAAGVGGLGATATPEGPLPMAELRRIFEVNLFGTFNVARLAAARMLHNRPEGEADERGLIVNVSSISAFQPLEGAAAYCASKAAVAALTRPMAYDLARHGVRVNAVAPGIFETPMLASLPPDVKRDLAANVPFPQRCGKPAEFAAAVATLVDNPYFNGTVLRLDGAAR